MTGVFRDARKRGYLNPAGADRPLKSPIAPATLAGARAYRKRRLVEQLRAHDCAAMLMFDPVNIRYAFDVSNMQVWMLRNASHYAVLCADGYGIDFEYGGSEHVTKGLETIDEVRPALTWFYSVAGGRVEERLNLWADEIADVLRKRMGKGPLRVAVDKIDPLGVHALESRGFVIVDGQQVAELARCVKSPEELQLMQWTVRVCEAGMARMYEQSLPGRTENEIWAELHFENIRSGGEWVETRLLAAGQRTNPWFQECSDHVAQAGDLIAFDTDLIGPYGYCADLSRAWVCGHGPMNAEQKALYAAAREQIDHNLSVLKAGMSFREFNEKSWRIPEKYLPRRYALALHGVGLADEYPYVPLHTDFARAYDGRFEENMTVCVESLIGEEGGRECVKLETQALITSRGAVRLDSFPWEEL
jgi:Xaa-Pro aminopeptidase